MKPVQLRAIVCALAVAATVAVCSPAEAQSTTTAVLLDQCRPKTVGARADADRRLCLTFVQAIADLLYHRGEICIPGGTTAGQVRDTVLRWIAKQHSPRGMVAAAATFRALTEAFPCSGAQRAPLLY